MSFVVSINLNVLYFVFRLWVQVKSDGDESDGDGYGDESDGENSYQKKTTQGIKRTHIKYSSSFIHSPENQLLKCLCSRLITAEEDPAAAAKSPLQVSNHSIW